MSPLGFITGTGKTRFGPSSKTLVQLAHEAMLDALADASVSARDVDAIVVANFLGGPNEGQLHLNSVVAGLLPGMRVPIWRVEAACASGGVAVHQALLALSQYERVLVLGVEKLTGTAGAILTHNIGMAGDVELDQSVGLTFPASYALVAQCHAREFGTTKDDLDLISFKNHTNARHNPKAHFHHKVVTMSDVKSAPIVAAPLALFDCCPVSDGAAAVVLERTRRDERSVPVLASAVVADAISLVQRDALTGFPAARDAAKRAYAQAGLGPADISLAEVHDCFTIAELVAIEDLGFAEPGQAAALVRLGETDIGGRIPVNPSGGLKAGGHAIGATGVGQLYEIVGQLRGDKGANQVADPRFGLAHNVGGVGGTCSVHIVGRPS